MYEDLSVKSFWQKYGSFFITAAVSAVLTAVTLGASIPWQVGLVFAGVGLAATGASAAQAGLQSMHTGMEVVAEAAIHFTVAIAVSVITVGIMRGVSAIVKAKIAKTQTAEVAIPGTKTPRQLAKEFINVPNKYKYTHYVEIIIDGLNVIKGREGVYVILNEGSLGVSGRIVSYGAVGGI